MSLEENLYNKIKERVKDHRNRFVRIFSSRYYEMIPSLISYLNNSTSIDFLKVEVGLLDNINIVLGESKNKNIQILGYINTNNHFDNPISMFNERKLTKRDIIFTVPKYIIPDKMEEISYLDNCKTGNFTVIRNKTLNYVSDKEIIQHYTSELAELAISRYSLAMQAKIITFFIGDENDESINELVADLYNGSPIVKAGKFFDPEENIYHMENDGISSNFAELKREYQNKIGELNNMLGINSLAVDKESGVSDVEAKSNTAYTTSVANIKLSARNHAIEKLNKRFNLNIDVVYNDEVASEFRELGYGEENKKDGEIKENEE